ncbi:MAG TPA: PAS domain-containing sensor histidine kinase [Gemmatimonadaceae bacterium]|nr:PAS domain-containing sensor histidine kinase [Gemmatimonadaceae bacterium]
METDHAATGVGPLEADNDSLYKLLVESVVDYAIFLLDVHGNVASWNEGAQRINGYTREEIVGRHFSTFYTAEDKARHKPEWELDTATREGRVEDEAWRVRKDGSLLWANVVITALRDPSGQLIGFAKVTRDLSERRAAEQRALADAKRVAESDAANRAKSEFLAVMSHELRTPLNAIAGYTQLLELEIPGAVNDKQRDILERIARSHRHLLGLINDILNLARIEAGRVEYRIEDVPLDVLMNEILPMIEPQLFRKKLGLAVRIPPHLVVRADREKTQQILINLLSNAGKFTPPDGQIAITAAADTDRPCMAAITVEDNGVGIPADKLEVIFDPFVQVDPSHTRTTEGSGLGLAISRDLARGMGGDIRVRSVLGGGSTFLLTLPRAEAGAEKTSG